MNEDIITLLTSHNFIYGTIVGGIIASALANIFGAIVKELITKYKVGKSSLTGIWTDEILGDNGETIKKDIVELKHYGDVIKGKIKRTVPEEEKHRVWNLYGRMIGNNLIAIYWPKEIGIPSFGCFFIQLKSDYKFEGYYLKLDRITNEFKKTRVNLLRKKSK